MELEREDQSSTARELVSGKISLRSKGPRDEAPVHNTAYFALLITCAVSLLGTTSFAAKAMPLSTSAFDDLAVQCAPGVAISTLRAVARVESNFEPLAIRDNNSRQTWNAKSLSAAVKLAADRMNMGHSIDLGLMQINSKNLSGLKLGITDAFDACMSLRASNYILHTALAAGSSETEREAALLIQLSRYNTGKPLAGVTNGYANEVISTYRDQSANEYSVQAVQATAWNIWRTSDVAPTSWFVTADGSIQFERAGAQTSDARNEGRAPASPSEKGEPYELSAYQESDPTKR